MLNCVGPTCQNLHRNSFTYHTVGAVAADGARTAAGTATAPASNPRDVPFEECIQFLEQARSGGHKVLVYCMSGTTRSPSVVIAYLMRLRRWRLAESYRWVKERRDVVNLQPKAAAQLKAAEIAEFGEEINATVVGGGGGAEILGASGFNGTGLGVTPAAAGEFCFGAGGSRDGGSWNFCQPVAGTNPFTFGTNGGVGGGSGGASANPFAFGAKVGVGAPGGVGGNPFTFGMNTGSEGAGGADGSGNTGMDI